MGNAGLMSCHKRKDEECAEFMGDASRDDDADDKRPLRVQMALVHG